MPSNQELTRGRQSPVLSEMVALSYSYRLILFMLFLGPVLILALPLVSWTALLIFDFAMNRQTALTLFMTFVSSKVIENKIASVAPTKRDADEALKRPFLIRFLMFAASIIVSHFVITALGNDYFTLPQNLSFANLSFAMAVRFAIGAFLLGISVVFRYIGPNSVARCSSSLLFVNPVAGALRSVFSSADSFIKFLTEPNNEPTKWRESKPKLVASRLQRPTIQVSFVQIIFSGFISCAFAFTSVLPFFHDGLHGDSPLKIALIFSCVVSGLIQVFLTTLDGTSHEINPKRYRSNFRNSNVQTILDSTSMKQSIFYLVLVLTLIKFTMSISLKDSLCCFVAGLAIMLQLYLFDFMLRDFLCFTPPNIRGIVEEGAGDGSVEVFLDVVLRSICQSNNELVRELSDVSTSAACLDLEREELKRSDAAITVMATTLLYDTCEAGPPLEGDILRLAILTSIADWVCSASATSKEWGSLAEPYMVPLCRALCTYFGGLGEALILSTAEDHIIRGEWLVPPGSVFLAECAVEGAVFYLTNKKTHLATLISTFLNSSHRLETGLIKYARGLGGIKQSSTEQFDAMRLLQTNCPELVPLFSLINSSTKSLLENTSNDLGRLDFLDSFELQHWCREKLASPGR